MATAQEIVNNQKKLKEKAAAYFKVNADESVVFITDDGQCFSKDSESAARLHAKNKKISVNEYKK